MSGGSGSTPPAQPPTKGPASETKTPSTDTTPTKTDDAKKNTKKESSKMHSARMLFPTSGRIGFDPIRYDGPKIDKSVLKAMLSRENEIRLTETIQNLYDSCALTDSEKYTEVTTNLQKQVLREFGFVDDEQGLTMLRSALTMYPDDPELKNLVYYHKYNRSKQGDLKVGDKIDLSTIQLVNTAGTTFTELSSHAQPDRPLVLIAGSIS
jgi:hypothetical protein